MKEAERESTIPFRFFLIINWIFEASILKQRNQNGCPLKYFSYMNRIYAQPIVLMRILEISYMISVWYSVYVWSENIETVAIDCTKLTHKTRIHRHTTRIQKHKEILLFVNVDAMST